MPTSAPLPVMTLYTPAGRPASARTPARSSALPGVRLAGLAIIVQPAAIAGATFHDSSSSGKFHGVIIATTPDRLVEDEAQRLRGVLRDRLAAHVERQRGVVVEHVSGQQDLVARQ